MLKHIVIRIEFDLFNQDIGILLYVDCQSCAKCYKSRARQNLAFLLK
jgi:hypothetical protein